MGFIYKVTNLVNGKIYIGQTRNTIEQRKSTHTHSAKYHKDNTIFHNSIRKHGVDNFSWEIVCKCLEELLDDMERGYIKKYKSMYYESGYNMITGGHSGGLLTEEIKKKISISKMGDRHSYETKKRISDSLLGDKNPMFGKQHTKETKTKMSTNGKGKFGPNNEKHYLKNNGKLISGKNNPNKKVILKLNKKMIVVHEYNTLMEACSDNNISDTWLRNIIKNKKIKNDFYFKYKDT